MSTLEWIRYEWLRAAAVLSALIGVGLVVVGWLRISDVSLTTEQIPYLASGAVGGLFALGVAATLWLSADLRDEHAMVFEKLEEIQRDLAGHREATVPEAAEPGALSTPPLMAIPAPS